MNTRVQVEHPVTEMVTGRRLVRCRFAPRRARSSTCPTRGRGTSAATPSSAASTPRIRRRSRPGRALITEYFPPGGSGVRVDSGVYGGWRVPPDYDSLLAKVIAHAPTRAEAMARMRRALDEFIVGGIRTNIELHKRLLEEPTSRRQDDDADHRADARRRRAHALTRPVALSGKCRPDPENRIRTRRAHWRCRGARSLASDAARAGVGERAEGAVSCPPSGGSRR